MDLTPVSFKIVLKDCKYTPTNNAKEKKAKEKEKPQKNVPTINKKSYLSSKVINKYPMTLKNV